MTVRQTGARWITLATVITLSALALPGQALGSGDYAAVAPPSTPVTVTVQTVNGSGCPAGTASVTMLPDNTGFRITYSDFLARAGGTVPATDFRKNCQVNLLVHIPQGFTFAVARADYWGKLRLAAGASALERSNYYYQGSSDDNYVDHSIAGPTAGTWHTVDVTDDAELVYAACGAVRSLNINTELRVDPGTATATTSYISLRASEGDVYTVVQFQWKQC
ncbi:DUF4360 domain-containing protein [Actinoplanes sp. NPDC051343]|jgi:hypothetical protein|uniref:DUF4360 domain-containing protein n=1 Tax=Actinoplanes sp. NPDC051343 TaxID=3363906 RepID=UPI0037A46CED